MNHLCGSNNLCFLGNFHYLIIICIPSRFSLTVDISFLGKGYKKDQKALRAFFEDTLKYDVFWEGDQYQDVTRDTLLETLKSIQKMIAAEAKNAERRHHCDRFVFVILTHGSEVLLFILRYYISELIEYNQAVSTLFDTQWQMLKMKLES